VVVVVALVVALVPELIEIEPEAVTPAEHSTAVAVVVVVPDVSVELEAVDDDVFVVVLVADEDVPVGNGSGGMMPDDEVEGVVEGLLEVVELDEVDVEIEDRLPLVGQAVVDAVSVVAGVVSLAPPSPPMHSESNAKTASEANRAGPFMYGGRPPDPPYPHRYP
jgi:hypothetical protein